MRKILMIVFLALNTVSYTQTKYEVDARLVDNHGEEIYNILEYRKDYYKFLLFELEYAFEVVDLSATSGLVVKNINEILGFQVSELENLETFNLLKYDFIRSKEYPSYYDLGNGKVLKIIPLMELWQAFRESGLNNKN
jgi:hypothetical protein